MQSRTEGVELTKSEQDYLLPHFFLLVVGKPGSGKSNIVRQLVNEKPYYKGKFDKTIIISPSAQKLGVRVSKEDTHSTYDINWLFEQIVKINQKQIRKMRTILKSREKKAQIPFMPQSIIKQSIGGDMKAKENQRLPPEYLAFNKIQRFFSAEILSIMNQGVGAHNTIINRGGQEGGMIASTKLNMKKRDEKLKDKAKSLIGVYGQYVDVDDIERQLVSKLEPSEQKETLFNLLIILDDVVGDIKKMENDFKQAQLFLNRRHLIANGTISLILVSQKFTMVPARLRSNSNWMILFRLNPVDFDNVYKDVVMVSPQRWQQMLNYVYGIDEDTTNETKAQKKYDNLGIWIEYDMFFKNLQQLTFK